MRTGAAAGHVGHFHEVALYGSEEEFVATVVPFLDDGVAAGEPTLVALVPAREELVRAAVRDSSRITFLSGGTTYLRPSDAIASCRETVGAHAARGAAQIRLIGEIPRAGVGVPWDWWARFEAAINTLYDDFPLWALCAYDTRVTPPAVVTDVLRTHPYLATASGQHLVNDRYEDPAAFLARWAGAPDPIEAGPPRIDLVDPTASAARRAVPAASAGSEVGTHEVEDLVIAVSEAVTNGLCHGRRPVRLRIWAGSDRLVATVSDSGAGPSDPFAGLVPTTETTSGGLGLWITHQLCSHVTFHRDDDGFTVRLVVGTPHVS